MRSNHRLIASFKKQVMSFFSFDVITIFWTSLLALLLAACLLDIFWMIMRRFNCFKNTNSSKQGNAIEQNVTERNETKVVYSFPQFAELDKDMSMHILSYISDAPLEINDIRKSPRGTLTGILPLVSKQFYCFSRSDYLWRGCLERLCDVEPDLWKKGLLKLMNGERSHPEGSLVDNVRKASPDLDYKNIFRLVYQTYIRYTGPIFFMPGFVSLGTRFQLHLFEPRYRLLIAEVMRGWPEAARRGGRIEPSPSTGSLPTFIYGHVSPLAATTPACLVEVHHCEIFPNGTADVELNPVAYVWLERVWQRRNSGRLYEASCLRMGSEDANEQNLCMYRSYFRH